MQQDPFVTLISRAEHQGISAAEYLARLLELDDEDVLPYSDEELKALIQEGLDSPLLTAEEAAAQHMAFRNRWLAEKSGHVQ